MTCCPETDFVCLTEKLTINPDHIFDMNCFDSMLYTTRFWASVQSFFIWVVEVPRKNSLLPVGLFFIDFAMFHLFSVLQILSLLFLCKLFFAIKKNSTSSWKSLFPVEVNYFYMDTNPSNHLMMSFVWRDFSSVRRKMMKEDSGVINAQAWGCPHEPPN